jgi:hypothetical protein
MRTGACPRLPTVLPASATRLTAGETYRAQCCRHDCGYALPFETLPSYKVEPAGRASVS